jgi:RNA recognition motif-containing protein
MHKKKNLVKVKEEELLRKIFIAGIKKSTQEQSLEEYFGRFGQIENILINRDIRTGKVKGCGFILFSDKRVAQELISSNKKHFVQGAMLTVKKCLQKGYKKQRSSNTLEGRSPKSKDSSLHNVHINQKNHSEKDDKRAPNLDFESVPKREAFKELIKSLKETKETRSQEIVFRRGALPQHVSSMREQFLSSQLHYNNHFMAHNTYPQNQIHLSGPYGAYAQQQYHQWF